MVIDRNCCSKLLKSALILLVFLARQEESCKKMMAVIVVENKKIWPALHIFIIQLVSVYKKFNLGFYPTSEYLLNIKINNSVSRVFSQ